MGIVPALNKIDDRTLSFRHTGKTTAVDQFALERRKKALTKRIVVAIPHRLSFLLILERNSHTDSYTWIVLPTEDSVGRPDDAG